jgi:hypothetical protein
MDSYLLTCEAVDIRDRDPFRQAHEFLPYVTTAML